ncbi:MAG: hypothetical protein ABSG43_00425 [Solirubrobacteraceae bacterium]|jgi:uncharacterized membrane protein YhaH (DUF805 family)
MTRIKTRVAAVWFATLAALLTLPAVALAAPGTTTTTTTPGGYTFDIKPNASAPGIAGIQTGTNDVAAWALAACGLALVTSLLLLAAAKGFHLERLHSAGKEGVIVALAAAFFVGLATVVLNAAYTMA